MAGSNQAEGNIGQGFITAMSYSRLGLGGPRYSTAMATGLRQQPEFVIDEQLIVPVWEDTGFDPVPEANFFPTSQEALQGYTLRFRISGQPNSNDTITLHLLGNEYVYYNTDFYPEGSEPAPGEFGCLYVDFGGSQLTAPLVDWGQPVYREFSTTEEGRTLEDASLMAYYNILKPTKK
jgi:hypothetical protein